MAQASAQLNDYRQAPRKARLVATLVRGKKVSDALTELSFLGKRGALPFSKLILSALANARLQKLNEESLVIKEIRVDQGKTLYRRGSASRGRAPLLRKRTSHIKVLLEEKVNTAKASKKKEIASK